MDLIRPNGPNRYIVDREWPNWTEWIEVDRIRPNGLKWTELYIMNEKGPNKT